MSERVALVTGANRGIGMATAIALQEKGFEVTGTYRSRSPNVEALTARGIRMLPVDVTSSAAIQGICSAVEESHHLLDVLVNNAGVSPKNTIEEASPEELARTLHTNLLGPAMCAKFAAPLLRLGENPVIVNVSSRLADTSRAIPNYAAYCASKAGLEGLTVSLAEELRPDRIRVYAYRPLRTDTDMTRAELANNEAAPPASFATPEETAASIVRLIGSMLPTGTIQEAVPPGLG